MTREIAKAEIDKWIEDNKGRMVLDKL